MRPLQKRSNLGSSEPPTPVHERPHRRDHLRYQHGYRLTTPHGRPLTRRSQRQVLEVLVAVLVEVGVVGGDEAVGVVLVVEGECRVGVALADVVGDVDGVSRVGASHRRAVPEVAVDSHAVDDFDVNSQFLATESFDRCLEFLALVEATAGPEPLAPGRFVRPPADQHSPVAFEQYLDTDLRERVETGSERLLGHPLVVYVHSGANAGSVFGLSRRFEVVPGGTRHR